MSKIIAKPGAAYDVLRATSAAQIAAAARLSQPTVVRVFRGEPCQIKTAKKLWSMKDETNVVFQQHRFEEAIKGYSNVCFFPPCERA